MTANWLDRPWRHDSFTWIVDYQIGARHSSLVERALRERWPIPEALRGPLIDRLAGLGLIPKSGEAAGDLS